MQLLFCHSLFWIPALLEAVEVSDGEGRFFMRQLNFVQNKTNIIILIHRDAKKWLTADCDSLGVCQDGLTILVLVSIFSVFLPPLSVSYALRAYILTFYTAFWRSSCTLNATHAFLVSSPPWFFAVFRLPVRYCRWSAFISASGPQRIKRQAVLYFELYPSLFENYVGKKF